LKHNEKIKFSGECQGRENTPLFFSPLKVPPPLLPPLSPRARSVKGEVREKIIFKKILEARAKRNNKNKI